MVNGRCHFILGILLSLVVGTPQADEFAVGKALKTLLIAEHLRGALLQSECKTEMGPTELRFLRNNQMHPAITALQQRLSASDHALFRRLAQSAEHQAQLRRLEQTYISDNIGATRDGSLSFACGKAFQQVSEVMQRANLANREAQTR